MDFRSMFMGLAYVLMWSSAFSSARIIVQDAPPLMALSVRFLVSGLAAILIAMWSGQSARMTAAQWRNTIIYGVCQNGLYLGLFFVAMQWIGAGLAAIIASAMPLVVAALSRIFLNERVGPLGVAGLLAGFAGVALIMGSRVSGGADPLGLLLCAIGVLALAVATLAVRGATSGGNIMMIVGLQMLVASAVLAPVALMLEEPLINWSPRLGLAFAYTTIVPGLLATWVWFRLIGRIGSTRAAAYHFLNPFFGVAIAAALLGEPIGLRDLLGVAIITAGIWAVQVSRRTAPA
ncbi:MAG: DMT family transporter [Paracoccaceae bacterium]|nr:DMT family transporter [Paracoccaceae bacterium]